MVDGGGGGGNDHILLHEYGRIGFLNSEIKNIE
jgi:hypothetical protein